MSPEAWICSQHSAGYDDPDVAARAARVLDDRERFRWRRLADPATRRDYLAAHLLRRGMLAARTGLDASSFRFRSESGGRPMIVGPPAAVGLSASLAHADGVVVCAVVEGLPIGADVESRRNLSGDLTAIAAMIGSLRALETLDARPGETLDERFLKLWTVREAIGKARGVGIGVPALPVEPGAIWQIACWRLGADHLAAVAVRRPDGDRVVLRIECDVMETCA